MIKLDALCVMLVAFAFTFLDTGSVLLAGFWIGCIFMAARVSPLVGKGGLFSKK